MSGVCESISKYSYVTKMLSPIIPIVRKSPQINAFLSRIPAIVNEERVKDELKTLLEISENNKKNEEVYKAITEFTGKTEDKVKDNERLKTIIGFLADKDNKDTCTKLEDIVAKSVNYSAKEQKLAMDLYKLNAVKQKHFLSEVSKLKPASNSTQFKGVDDWIKYAKENPEVAKKFANKLKNSTAFNWVPGVKQLKKDVAGFIDNVVGQNQARAQNDKRKKQAQAAQAGQTAAQGNRQSAQQPGNPQAAPQPQQVAPTAQGAQPAAQATNGNVIPSNALAAANGQIKAQQLPGTQGQALPDAQQVAPTAQAANGNEIPSNALAAANGQQQVTAPGQAAANTVQQAATQLQPKQAALQLQAPAPANNGAAGPQQQTANQAPAQPQAPSNNQAPAQPQPGNGNRSGGKYKKSNERVQIKNMNRVVYKGSRGGSYVKMNGGMVPLKKAMAGGGK